MTYETRKYLLLAVALLAALLANILYRQVLIPYLRGDFAPPVEALNAFSVDERPNEDLRLFDYAGVLEGSEEGIGNYLDRLRTSAHLDMVIVTLPTAPDTTEKTAFRIFNAWGLGKETEGRGVLVLMVADKGEVKIEVSQNMEDVFTDLFSGYAADQQLKPHLAQGTAGFGLVAIMEEFEQRAYLKEKGSYTPEIIAARDRKFLSMGGGVTRDTNKYDVAPQQAGLPATDKKGVATPDDAWKMVVSKWLHQGKYKEFDIFTEATKLVSGDQDSIDYQWASGYLAQPYEILQAGDYAIVSFGAKEGWEKSPIFLMRTRNPDGWKVDFANQRKYVVMGQAPHWKIEIGNHPYVYLAGYAWTDTAKDLPIEIDDIYTAERDPVFGATYRSLRAKYEQGQNDFSTAIQLGRLGVIMALLPQDIYPYLKQAEKLDPSSPLPHKYKAIHAVESTFQYKTALREMTRFLDKGGDPAFGYNYLGFLQIRTGRHEDGIRSYLTALDYIATAEKVADEGEKMRLREQAMYALDRLVRAYYKKGDKEKMSLMYDRMRAIDPDHWRVALDGWVARSGYVRAR